jgi:hypothetical protein
MYLEEVGGASEKLLRIPVESGKAAGVQVNSGRRIEFVMKYELIAGSCGIVWIKRHANLVQAEPIKVRSSRDLVRHEVAVLTHYRIADSRLPQTSLGKSRRVLKRVGLWIGRPRNDRLIRWQPLDVQEHAGTPGREQRQEHQSHSQPATQPRIPGELATHEATQMRTIAFGRRSTHFQLALEARKNDCALVPADGSVKKIVPVVLVMSRNGSQLTRSEDLWIR